MIIEELTRLITTEAGFAPTAEQAAAMTTFAHFMTDRHDRTVMIMHGSAGTGKTSLAAAIVRTMNKIGQKTVLLAPTGRAAKVFSLNAGMPAMTIHRKIYRQLTFTGDMTGFNLNDNLHSDTLFIIDEASMTANGGQDSTARFGTGRLLDDIITYVYSGRNCRLLLIGDKAQLPPVGEEESPALSPEYMAGYGLRVYESSLSEVLRQARDSGILYNATVIRGMITHDELTRLPLIRFRGFADIISVPGGELIEQLGSSYSRVGTDDTIIITRSNKRAAIYNKGVRAMVLGREEELSSGDMLMIVRNNYYYGTSGSPSPSLPRGEGVPNGESHFAHQQTNPSYNIKKVTSASLPTGEGRGGAAGGLGRATGGRDRAVPAHDTSPSFLANGDRARVQRVRNVRELYGFRFADLWLRLPDYDDYELQVTAILDSLSTETPALTHEQSEQLFNAVLEDYSDLPRRTDRMKSLRADPYYNALQVKFAYAVTCHKAQGGQWAHVYVDQGYMTDDMLTPDYIHWLYTAFTRATEKLFLVNWPKTQTES